MPRCITWLLAALLLLPAVVRAEQCVVVAGLFTLSGPTKAVAAPSVQGARLAVEEINKAGGVLGRKLRLQLFDTRATAIGAALAAEQAANSTAVAIVGPSPSSQALPAARVAEQARIPLIAHTATHPDITKDKSWVFRICATDKRQGEVMAELLRQRLQAETAVLLLSVSSDYSLALGREFNRRFEKLGGEVVKTLYYRDSLQAIDELVAEVNATGADACFIPGHAEAGRLASVIQESGAACIPAGGDAWGARAFLLSGGVRLEPGYFCNHWSPAIDRPRSREFVTRYEGTVPLESQTILAYDAVRLLADALQRAGRADRDALRRALTQTRNFQGVAGRINYESGHDPNKTVVPMVIRRCKARLLAPETEEGTQRSVETP
jgi:branched-chain amino acid transport system substrate-binding protein